MLEQESRNERLYQKGEQAGGGVIQPEEAQQRRSSAQCLGGLRLENKIEQRRADRCREHKARQLEQEWISLNCLENRRLAGGARSGLPAGALGGNARHSRPAQTRCRIASSSMTA